MFCAVGTLGHGINKRVDVCIRALATARLAGTKAALVICGDGEQRSELEELAQSLGIASYVKLLGTAPMWLRYYAPAMCSAMPHRLSLSGL